MKPALILLGCVAACGSRPGLEVPTDEPSSTSGTVEGGSASTGSPAMPARREALWCRGSGDKPVGVAAEWTFETGSPEGWYLFREYARPVSAELSVSSGHARSGRYSLTTSVTFAPTATGRFIEIRRDLCPEGMTVDLTNKTVAAWFRMDGPPVPPDTYCGFILDGHTRYTADVFQTRVSLGEWQRITGTLPDVNRPAWIDIPISIEVICDMAPALTSEWTGTITIDDVTIE